MALATTTVNAIVKVGTADRRANRAALTNARTMVCAVRGLVSASLASRVMTAQALGVVMATDPATIPRLVYVSQGGAVINATRYSRAQTPIALAMVRAAMGNALAGLVSKGRAALSNLAAVHSFVVRMDAVMRRHWSAIAQLASRARLVPQRSPRVLTIVTIKAFAWQARVCVERAGKAQTVTSSTTSQAGKSPSLPRAAQP